MNKIIEQIAKWIGESKCEEAAENISGNVVKREFWKGEISAFTQVLNLIAHASIEQPAAEKYKVCGGRGFHNVGSETKADCKACHGTGTEPAAESPERKCEHGETGHCWKCECEEWRKEGRLMVKVTSGDWMLWDDWQDKRNTDSDPFYCLSKNHYRRATDAELAASHPAQEPPRCGNTKLCDTCHQLPGVCKCEDRAIQPKCAKCGKECEDAKDGRHTYDGYPLCMACNEALLSIHSITD